MYSGCSEGLRCLTIPLSDPHNAGVENVLKSCIFFMPPFSAAFLIFRRIFMKTNTQKLTLCAVVVALSTLLSAIKIFHLPLGGSVTLASMVPIIVLSFFVPVKWALTASFACSLIQLMNPYLPPAKNFSIFIIAILFDYIFAFGSIGLAGFFSKFMPKRIKYTLSCMIVIFLRFLCHATAGVLVWKTIWVESVIYNGSYMIFELIISTIMVSVIVPILKRRVETL